MWIENPRNIPSPENLPRYQSANPLNSLNWCKEDPDEMGDLNLFLPFSHLNEWIYEPSILLDTHRVFPLYLLENRRSLGALSSVAASPNDYYHIPFQHDRVYHSLGVTRVAQHIATRSGLCQEQFQYLTLAALAHDLATPAGGDAVMAIDKPNLNEEDHWQKVLSPEQRATLQSWKVDFQFLDDIIHNQGILGQILDIADRITYVAQDVFFSSASPHGLMRISDMPPENQATIDQIQTLVNQDRYFADIYKDVKVDQTTEQVYFTNSNRLGRFLQIRALLTQGMYTTPYNQARDCLLGKVLTTKVPGDPETPLYDPEDPNKLTPAKLRPMTDRQLFVQVAETINTGVNASSPRLHEWHLWNFYHLIPGYQRFDLNEQDKAESFCQEVAASSDTAFLGVRSIKGMNDGTSYLVKQGRKVLPFSQVNPEATEKIKQTVDRMKGHFVYFAKPGKNFPYGSRLEKILFT